MKNPMRVFVSEDLVVLDKINAIDTEAPERFVELPRGLFLRPAINLRHEECFLAIAVADCLSHAYLAGAFVVIPAVIQKVDTPIYCRAHDSNRELLINVLQTKMPATHTDCRNFLAGASETSIDHHFTLLPSASISRTPGKMDCRLLPIWPAAAHSEWHHLRQCIEESDGCLYLKSRLRKISRYRNFGDLKEPCAVRVVTYSQYVQ